MRREMLTPGAVAEGSFQRASKIVLQNTMYWNCSKEQEVQLAEWWCKARNSWSFLLMRTVRVGLCDNWHATALLPRSTVVWKMGHREQEGRNHPSCLHERVSEGLNCSCNGTQTNQRTPASIMTCPSGLSCMQQMNASLSDSSACFAVDLNYHVK